MINTQKIVDAIIASGVSPLACEVGSNLLDAWIDRCFEQDIKRTVVAVETGFVCWIDGATAIIGVQDALTDEDGIVGNEWKSTKEKTKYWNSDTWKESISTGHQIAVYALALTKGTYYERKTEKEFQPRVTNPRIRVRAASKSNPPDIWPRDGNDIIKFDGAQLANVERGLLSKAASIRAMRKANIVPFQLPGIWCRNQFRKLCEFHDDCLAGNVPLSGALKFDGSDPAAQLAMKHIGDKLNDPDLVILSSSSYGSASECAEKYRRISLTDGHKKEEDMALMTGSALHAGIAAYLEQIREIQQSNTNLTK